MIKMNGLLRFVESLTFLRNFCKLVNLNYPLPKTNNKFATESRPKRLKKEDDPDRLALLAFFVRGGLAWPCMSVSGREIIKFIS